MTVVMLSGVVLYSRIVMVTSRAGSATESRLVPLIVSRVPPLEG